MIDIIVVIFNILEGIEVSFFVIDENILKWLNFMSLDILFF